MRSRLLSFLRDRSGVAAAEMAMVMPLLLALMFGAFELGNFFLSEHVVVKAVRDGARFAGRQPFTEYPSCSPSTTVRDNTRNVTRTGQVASGGTPRLRTWTNPASITVTATCNNSGTYSGIYRGNGIGAPVVQVSATVPYTPLLGQLGIARVSMTLTARSQATVDGI